MLPKIRKHGRSICVEIVETNTKSKQIGKLISTVTILGIIFVSFNLRPAITSVGPLVNDIQNDLNLAHWSAGILTSLPLIAFAVMSPIVPNISSRLTNGWTLIVGLVILLIGLFIRTTANLIMLFTGTFLVGVGIAVMNVMLPVIVKDLFPQKFAIMTSVYTTSMSIFAALASGVSVPLASGLNLGWKMTLLVWSIPAIIALIIWILLVRIEKNHQAENVKSITKEKNNLWRSPLAWQIALFMGLQSFLFYVTIAWLPDILHSKGLSWETAGWLLSFTQFIGLPANFFVPILAERSQSQQKFALGICSLTIIGYFLLLVSTTNPLIVIAIGLVGFSSGGMFSLALAFLGMRAKNAADASRLSGMAQSLGYIFAAFGPTLIGFLFDFAKTWNVPILALILVSILTAFFASRSGQNRFV